MLNVAGAQPQGGCPPPPPPFATQSPTAPARDHGLLWRVERDGRTSWLFGTVHIGKPEWLVPGPRLLHALRNSDTIALEIDLGNVRELQALMQPADPAIAERVLDARLRTKIDAEIRRTCAPEAFIRTQRPLMQVMTLSLLDARRHGLHLEMSLDAWLAGIARGTGKRLVALETVAQQIAALTPGSDQEERELVDRALATLGTPRMDAVFHRIASTWAQGDEAALVDYERWCECMETDAERRLMARLNEGRNPAMADKLAAIHSGGHRFFAGVGALHMVGPKGLATLLRARGFVVERVRFD